MKKIFALLLALCCISVSALAQRTVTGTVHDENGDPLIGATVTAVGTNISTATDYDGRYTLNVPQGTKQLSFSYVGYHPLTADITGNRVDVTMKPNDQVLDEVIVIGYGSVKKGDATGSVQAVKPDDLNHGAQVTVQDALVGKIAGVNIISSSGAPGSGSQIRIRSGASLSASNDPLFVIDGVPVDNSSIEGASNLIGGINPDDIETFTVLKDASATAIYGSRASNGVIVITTKKGGDNLKVTYNGNYSISNTAKRLEVLSASEFKKIAPTVTGFPADAVFGTADTDWQDEIFRTAFGTDQNISVGGKISKKVPFRVSGGYTNQDGIIRTNNYQRATASVSLNPSLFRDHLTLNINAKFGYERNRGVTSGVVGNALRYDPTRPVKTGSATAATDPGLGYFIWTNGGAPMAIQTDNPVAQLELDTRINKVYRNIGSAAAVYKIHGLEDLQLNANFGYDVLTSDYNRTVPDLAGMMYTSNLKDGTGLVNDASQNKKNFLLDLYAYYSHQWGKHNFDAMAGYGWQHFWKKYYATYTDWKNNPVEADDHYESEYYLLSWYGRVNYSFDNRFLITATLRADASSRFSKKNRWGYFPSVALAWRVIEEDFMKEQDVMSDFKIRATYGQTGQQDIINDYPWMTTFTISQPGAMYQFGDKWYYTYRPNGFDNDIKWETTTTWNFGVDYGFINNRIYGSIDYYRRYTKDLLNTIPVISGTNYAPVLTTNVGSMENQGVEISINTVPITTKDWEWTIGFNYTWQDSKITKLNVIDSDQSYVETGDISGTGKNIQVFMIGQTPYTFYMAKQVYDDNGKPIEGQYYQPDGSVSTTATRYATGKSALPSSLLGFNTRLRYKNWDLGINGHGALGNYVYNYVESDQNMLSVYSDQGSFSNVLKSTVETGFMEQQHYSDYFLEDGSFFRIDNITLGYTFKKLWNQKSNLRITFAVNNVYTFTHYKGIDPELTNGIDRRIYPRPRTFSLGLNLNF